MFISHLHQVDFAISIKIMLLLWFSRCRLMLILVDPCDFDFGIQVKISIKLADIAVYAIFDDDYITILVNILEEVQEQHFSNDLLLISLSWLTLWSRGCSFRDFVEDLDPDDVDPTFAVVKTYIFFLNKISENSLHKLAGETKNQLR